MNIKTSILYDVDEKDWNKQLMRDIHSTTYQTYNWAKLYEATYGSKPFFLVTESSDGKILGQLTAVIHDKYFWAKTGKITQFLGSRLNLSFIHWFYGPVIFDKNLTKEIVDSIRIQVDMVAKKHNVSMIRGITSPYLTNQVNSLFSKKGYSYIPWSTYIIDLHQKEDDLYNSLNKKTRYDIRKAGDDDLEFHVAIKRSELDKYLDLKYSALERHGHKTGKGNYDLIEKFNDAHWELLQEKNLEKLFLVKYKEELLGGIRCFIFNDNMYQQNVGNSEKKGLSGGTFLTWNSVKWGINNKKLTFDMGGVNPNPISEKEKYIDFYKSKWGGEKHGYGVYTKIIHETKFKLASVLKNPKKIINKINVR